MTTTFADWWFLNGGSIHGLWKGRKFSAIKVLAINLPKYAWDARQPEVDGLKSEIASLREALEKIHGVTGTTIAAPALWALFAELRSALDAKQEGQG